MRGPKAAQNISRGGRVWNPTRSYQPAHRFAPLQRRLVLQTRAVDVQRVDERQLVVRLVVGGVALEQYQILSLTPPISVTGSDGRHAHRGKDGTTMAGTVTYET